MATDKKEKYWFYCMYCALVQPLCILYCIYESLVYFIQIFVSSYFIEEIVKMLWRVLKFLENKFSTLSPWPVNNDFTTVALYIQFYCWFSFFIFFKKKNQPVTMNGAVL